MYKPNIGLAIAAQLLAMPAQPTMPIKSQPPPGRRGRSGVPAARRAARKRRNKIKHARGCK